MTRKFSIYAGAPVLAVLDGHTGNRSGRLNQVAADYLTLVETLKLPKFSEEEWRFLASVLDVNEIGSNQSLRSAWATVADAKPVKGVQVDLLADTLRALDLPALVVLREVLRRKRPEMAG